VGGMSTVLDRLKRRFGRRGSIRAFSYQGPRPQTAEASSDLADMFWSNTGTIVHKWHHYFPIYERHFGAFRGKPVRMLEVGVYRGGSLALWRRYFGPEAVIFGIDIDPACQQYDGQAGQVRIGSQADAAFVAGVIDEMGGVDIVLDDGSHDSRHIRATLNTVFPRLSEGGVYMVEDTHACYWRKFSGGYRARSSFMEVVKAMIDDLHHWYHGRGQVVGATRDALGGLHVYDSIVVLDKQVARPPQHTKVGQGAP
jgi:hypothetical protein